jgi:hypothetical protein
MRKDSLMMEMNMLDEMVIFFVMMMNADDDDDVHVFDEMVVNINRQ